jgi:hypothetical protein
VNILKSCFCALIANHLATACEQIVWQRCGRELQLLRQLAKPANKTNRALAAVGRHIISFRKKSNLDNPTVEISFFSLFFLDYVTTEKGFTEKH